MHWGSKLLLLDEPTAALGAEQSAEVQRIIRRTCDSGIQAIVTLQAKKQAMADALFEGKASGPLGLDEDDLAQLFRPIEAG